MRFRYMVWLFFNALLILCTLTNNAEATVYRSPVPSTCGDSYKNVAPTEDVSVHNKFCWLYGVGETAGGLWGRGAEINSGNSVDLEREFFSTYVPYSGSYLLRMYLCQSSGPGFCTIQNSFEYVNSAQTAKLVSEKTISSQDPDFGGNSTTQKVSSSFNICLVLVDTTGVVWGTADAVSCRDANQLPTIPAVCYLNSRADLNVDMGVLERSKIAIAPASGSAGNIKKTFPVLCTRDAGTTVSIKFQFTPLTISGNEVVSTDIANLGVAIFYEGKQVGPSSAPITETFKVGYTNRVLEFQAVRKPEAKPKDIPTGKFSASAVMVVTEQ